MTTTTTTNISLRPALPKKPGQRGRTGAARRAVIVDGTLQVGDASTRERGLTLKTSPSFSPAYLLAALEWAEDGENHRHGADNDHSRSDELDHFAENLCRPGGGARGARRPFPGVAPTALTHKTASNLRLRRRTDDVNPFARHTPASSTETTTTAAAATTTTPPVPPVSPVPPVPPAPLLIPRTSPATRGPTAPPRIDLLTEKLVFPSRKTPASFLPTPSSLSLDTAVRPVFLTSPISPGSRFPRRGHPPHRHLHQYQPQTQHHQSPHPQQLQPQQRRRTSNDVGRQRWYFGQHVSADEDEDEDEEENEASLLSADEAAQPQAETDRIFVATASASEGLTTGGKQVVYQAMQPSGVPPPSTKYPSPPRPPQGPVREAFAFLSRSRKKSVASSSPASTLSKRSPTSTTTTSTVSSIETDVSDSRQSPGFESVPKMPRTSVDVRNPTVKVSGASLAEHDCQFSCADVAGIVGRLALPRHRGDGAGHQGNLHSPSSAGGK